MIRVKKIKKAGENWEEGPVRRIWASNNYAYTGIFPEFFFRSTYLTVQYKNMKIKQKNIHGQQNDRTENALWDVSCYSVYLETICTVS